MNRRALFAEALSMPESDRLELAAELLASTPPPGVLSEKDPAFVDEIGHRLDELESGAVKAVPWEAVQTKLKATIDRERRKREGARRPSARSSSGFRTPSSSP